MNRIFTFFSKFYLIQLTGILLLVLCLPVTKSYAIKGYSLGEICQTSPSQCLEKVNAELKFTKKKSRVWFSLMQFKLSSLFMLQHSDELYRETKRWIHEDDLPVPFQVTLYMYYAKSILAHGDIEQGKKYIYKAKQQLALMHEVYPSPIKLIEIANLQMFIGELPEAYASLNALKDKYKNSQNPHFMMELFGHLGHVARQLGFYEQALEHWHTAIPWGHKYGNEQQIATIYFNLAGAQQDLQQYILAENSYVTAIQHAKIALDMVKAAHAKLHLAEVKLLLGEKNKAKALLLLVDEKLLSKSYLSKLNTLKGQL